MDQANGLRMMAKKDKMKEAVCLAETDTIPRVIAVTSGKGGVGKTNIVGNLAVAMAKKGKRVVILDADVGLANVDILFNLHPEYNIRHVINAEKSLKQVMTRSSHGINIIPGGSGFSDLTQLTEGEKLTLLSEFETLADEADIILVDTGAGISANVLYFNCAADDCVVVATTEPTSITDAYAMMKVMSQEHKIRRFKLIVNMVESPQDAKRVFASLGNALDKFLKNVVLEYLGYIPLDKQVKQSVQKRALFMERASDCEAARALEKIASILGNSPVKNRGNLTFFMDKVFSAGS